MFLFLEDHNTHGGIIHASTKNLSFLKMSVMLSRMGVRNNKFFLYLSQPDLVNYDPHNLTDNSMELRQRIAYETKVNPWYYFREVIRVPVAGTEAIPFKLSRASLALIWLYFNNADSYLIMPRQLGKTVGVLSINSWCLYIGAVNSTYGLFTKDSSLVAESVSKLKDIRKALPSYLVKESRHDTDNKEGLSYDALNNTYKTFVNQQEAVLAIRQGRGETLVSQQWDELPYYKNNHLSYPSATSASDAASRQARASGLPAANSITTTAGYLDTQAGAYAHKIMSDCMRFNELLYDLDNNDALHDILRNNSLNRMLYMEFSYKQLGEDDEWFKTVTRNKSPMEIETDYLNKWVLGTATPVVNPQILERMETGIMEPLHYTNHKSLMIRWYVPDSLLRKDDYKETPFIIGMDTSNCTGRDFTTLLLLEPKTMSVVGTCRCNLTNPVHIGSCLTTLLTEFPNSILMPERNANGAILIDIVIEFLLTKGISPFKRIYNSFIQNYVDEVTDFNTIDLRDGRNRQKFGFKTTASSKSREFLYSTVLTTMLNYMADRAHDADLVSEVKSLTIRKGRVDHRTDSHDDLCMALLLTGYMVLYGKNLHMYGVDSSNFFAGEVVNGNVVDPVYKEQQENMYKRIGSLRGLILNTTSGIIRSAYERELKYLESQLDPSALDSNVATVDQVKNVTPAVDDSVGSFTASFQRLNRFL